MLSGKLIRRLFSSKSKSCEYRSIVIPQMKATEEMMEDKLQPLCKAILNQELRILQRQAQLEEKLQRIERMLEKILSHVHY